MKFLHLADLHIGKRVNEVSMIEEQEHILQQILAYAEQEQPFAALLAGDIYDKPQPAAEAVQLFDGFLTALAGICKAVLIISGNHDSAQRLSFAAGLLQSKGVYLAKPFNGRVEKVRLFDEFGAVNFYLLPYFKPMQVRRLYDDAQDIATYDEAAARIMQEVEVDTSERNILLAHQFLTGAALSDSEELAVGGLDNISAAHFADFDYVALGHLHQPQQIERAEVRYAGSPLKYSFSEARQKKAAVFGEIAADGTVTLDFKPLIPLHDMREIKGNFAELICAKPCDDFLHITLQDEEDVLDAAARLRQVYPNLMKLDYDNLRGREFGRAEIEAEVQLSPLEMFAQFYQQRNNQPLKAEQQALLEKLIAEIWDEEE